MPETIRDLIIIGAGPAGITAAVYAARKKMDLVVLTQDVGGQASWSGTVENYIGYQLISGTDLVQKFEEHLAAYNIPVREGETVEEVRRQDALIAVRSNKGEYRSRTLIVASGKRSRELGVPGEKEFKNKGLTYCATCDGPLFTGKDVAVIGGGNSALDAALQLVRMARHVTLVNAGGELTGDAVMAGRIKSAANATVLNNATVTAITGGPLVRGITVQRGGLEDYLAVEGVFVEIGLVPSSEFIREVQKNSHGEIVVNCRSETNMPGIFAAGDVTDVPAKQIIVAAGEGAKATISAFRYLARQSF